MLALLVVTSYMGLPEFGVATSPDTEILHQMTFEPAHNHMGVLRPVPFDQMVVGNYTTREFEAEAGNEEAAVAAFTDELETTGQGEMLTNVLRAQHLTVPPLRFSTVPGDAPALRNAVEEFAHKIQAENQELVNGWGTIIVTQNQQDVKRIDLVISWDEVVVENGAVVVDENGNPVLSLDENGNPVRRMTPAHFFLHRDAGYYE
jgi:hypothetical protein